MGMQNGTIALQNSSVVSYKIKYSLTMSPSKSTQFPKQHENMFAKKAVHEFL